MPGTLMLLEKLRGAAPKLLDQSTYEMDIPDILTDDAKSRNEEAGLLPQESANTLSASQKPEDSGVGFSVGSSYNMTGAASSQMSQVNLTCMDFEAGKVGLGYIISIIEIIIYSSHLN